jgi:hypothetical protein
MYGIEPSHRQQHRNKYPIRLFLEERIVDLLHIFETGMEILADQYDYYKETLQNGWKVVQKNRAKFAIATVAIVGFILLMI